MVSRNGSTRWFAGMDPAKQKEAARKGGLARSKNQSGKSTMESKDQSDRGM